MAPHTNPPPGPVPTPGITSVAGGFQRAPELRPARSSNVPKPPDPPTPPGWLPGMDPSWKKFYAQPEVSEAAIRGRQRFEEFERRYRLQNPPDTPPGGVSVSAQPLDIPQQNENLAPQQSHHSHNPGQQPSGHGLQLVDARRRAENIPPQTLSQIPTQSANIPPQPYHHYQDAGHQQAVYGQGRADHILPELRNTQSQSENMPLQQYNHYQNAGHQQEAGYGPQEFEPEPSKFRNFVQTTSENIPRQHYRLFYPTVQGQQFPPQPLPGHPGWNENMPPQYFQHTYSSGPNLLHRLPPAPGPGRNESFRFEPYARPKSRHGPIPGHHGGTTREPMTTQAGFYDYNPQMQWQQAQQQQNQHLQMQPFPNQQQQQFQNQQLQMQQQQVQQQQVQVPHNVGPENVRQARMPKLHSWLHPLPLPKLRPSNFSSSRPNSSHGQNIQQEQQAKPLGGIHGQNIQQQQPAQNLGGTHGYFNASSSGRPNTNHGQAHGIQQQPGHPFRNIHQQQPGQALGHTQQQRPAQPLGDIGIHPNVPNPYPSSLPGGASRVTGARDNKTKTTRAPNQAQLHDKRLAYEAFRSKNLYGNDNNSAQSRRLTPPHTRPIPVEITRVQPHPPPTQTNLPRMPDSHKPTNDSTDEEMTDIPVPVPATNPDHLKFVPYQSRPSAPKTAYYQHLGKPPVQAAATTHSEPKSQPYVHNSERIDPVAKALSLGRHPLPTSRPAKYNKDLVHVKNLNILQQRGE